MTFIVKWLLPYFKESEAQLDQSYSPDLTPYNVGLFLALKKSS